MQNYPVGIELMTLVWIINEIIKCLCLLILGMSLFEIRALAYLWNIIHSAVINQDMFYDNHRNNGCLSRLLGGWVPRYREFEH